MGDREETVAGIGEQEYRREEIEQGEIGYDEKGMAYKALGNSSYLVYCLSRKSPPGSRWERVSKGKEVSS